MRHVLRAGCAGAAIIAGIVAIGSAEAAPLATSGAVLATDAKAATTGDVTPVQWRGRGGWHGGWGGYRRGFYGPRLYGGFYPGFALSVYDGPRCYWTRYGRRICRYYY